MTPWARARDAHLIGPDFSDATAQEILREAREYREKKKAESEGVEA